MVGLLGGEGKIGRLTIPNRVVMPAMGVNLASADGTATDGIIAFYEARARGGAGLIITEVTRVSGGAGISDPCQLAAYRVSDIASLQRVIDAVHKYETRIFIQLQHPGREASPTIAGEQPVAPSAVANPVSGVMPRALATAECKEMAERFINGAYIAQAAGADGVELHAAHGYLLNEFLSPAMNFRKDEYGGSFENRVRILREIIAGIRRTCGAFPVSVRINAEEALPGGVDLEEAAKIAAALEEAGADAINVSCYTDACIEPGTYAQGYKRHMSSAVKAAVKIPVISVSNIKEPNIAETLLQEGVCDFVGVGRAQIADSEWCGKAFSGRSDEIRKCIGCLCCFGEIVKARRVKCAVNPLAGREREFADIRADGNGRAVAIIGGGPAGIEAALTLRARGFAPVLFDDNPRPGGTLNVADKGYGKDKMTRYTDSLIALVGHAGIEVRAGEKATPETVKALNPCGVFVACGAEPLVPPIPGVELEQVCTAQDVLLGKIKPTGTVAIVGSGMTGLETAEMLAMDGCKVIFVEMLDTLGPGVYPAIAADVMSRITPRSPRLLTGHKLTRVTPGGVELERLSDGASVFAQADYIVLSMGVRPRKATADAFKAAFRNAHVIGDARAGGRILDATQDAHGKAFVFDPS